MPVPLPCLLSVILGAVHHCSQVIPRGAIPDSPSTPARSSASRQDGHRRSSSTVFPCAQGHSHSSAAGAARCASRPETKRSSSPTESTVSSVSGSVVSYTSGTPSRTQASPGGRVAASPAPASRSASRSGGSVREMPRTWNNWDRVRNALPTITDQAAHPAAAPPPAAPPAVALPPYVAPGPASAPAVTRSYIPHFDQEERGARSWYVVVVGRTVGVFRHW